MEGSASGPEAASATEQAVERVGSADAAPIASVVAMSRVPVAGTARPLEEVPEVPADSTDQVRARVEIAEPRAWDPDVEAVASVAEAVAGAVADRPTFQRSSTRGSRHEIGI